MNDMYRMHPRHCACKFDHDAPQQRPVSSAERAESGPAVVIRHDIKQFPTGRIGKDETVGSIGAECMTVCYYVGMIDVLLFKRTCVPRSGSAGQCSTKTEHTLKTSTSRTNAIRVRSLASHAARSMTLTATSGVVEEVSVEAAESGARRNRLASRVGGRRPWTRSPRFGAVHSLRRRPLLE